jgi:hypothetical protein
LRLMTTFIRFRSGLNLSGMLSHVFRPISTALILPSGAEEVTRAKYAISFGRRQGRVPPLPMPFDRVAATMSVNFVMKEEVEKRYRGKHQNSKPQALGINRVHTPKYTYTNKLLDVEHSLIRVLSSLIRVNQADIILHESCVALYTIAT